MKRACILIFYCETQIYAAVKSLCSTEATQKKGKQFKTNANDILIYSYISLLCFNSLSSLREKRQWEILQSLYVIWCTKAQTGPGNEKKIWGKGKKCPLYHELVKEQVSQSASFGVVLRWVFINRCRKYRAQIVLQGMPGLWS